MDILYIYFFHFQNECSNNPVVNHNEKAMNSYYPIFLRKKGNLDGLMFNYQVNAVFRKICKNCDPFKMRYERIKEIGAG